jgi:RimJ/RimL family protein N-acetyltransferase
MDPVLAPSAQGAGCAPAPAEPQREPLGPGWWPLFGLRLVTPRLLLRPVRDHDIPGLLEAIDAGIHDPGYMPFGNAWTDAPIEERRRSSAQWWWYQRAAWKPELWHLDLAVFFEDRPVGSQSVDAKNFGVLREIETGSWLTLSAQGQGVGKEMRAAVLQLAFEGLGCEVARSAAFADNAPSLGVSRALGYRANGTYRDAPRGVSLPGTRMEITRKEWEARSALLARAEIAGLEECLPMFGLGAR